MADVTSEVILALSGYPEGSTLSELAVATGRSASSVQRAVATLISSGVAIREVAVHPRYRLDRQAPISALRTVARWSLSSERAHVLTRKQGRGQRARRSAAKRLHRAAPGSSAERWIPAAVERVVERFDPTAIVLFGSQARGDARWDSDFDLLIVLPEVADRRAAAVGVRKALRDLPIAKDILVTSNEEFLRGESLLGTALHEARTEGLTVYERR